MRLYEQKIWWKRLLLFAAIGIGGISLWYTNNLVKKLEKEEEKKVLLWANATKELVKADSDFEFLLNIIKDNETIPVIVVDDNGNISAFRNLDSLRQSDTAYLKQELEEMKALHDPIKYLIHEGNDSYNYVYYKNSFILTQLKEYPYYQLSIIAVFILISYLAFSSSRRAEQNSVWVGLSKETAHQLGTPISSLNGWIELLRESAAGTQLETIRELQQDMRRLELVTERFSKIGSDPALKPESLTEVLKESIAYLSSRTSSKVKFILNETDGHVKEARMNKPLFEWVIENICKNAIDAMSGEGTITISYGMLQGRGIFIDITDTGKGIPKSKFKTVFKPGYTTKKRGWGLGLSLTKRIVQDYHKGKIIVKESELNKGATFRIILKA